ncbi:MAG: DUF3047 domain-containing protein [Deltaproteobacteria bacterium]|nr:DUF3047 domain-containing protein [Deltaproteobacteria bacterium]
MKTVKKTLRKKISLISLIRLIIISLSLAALSLAAAQGPVMMVALFSGLKEKVVPSDWRIEEWKGKADVQLVSDGSVKKALCLKSAGTSTALYKEISLNIKEYPFINWQWKVTKIPEKGDVRKRETDDEAAQIYVIFPKFPSQINSRMLGYIWDSNAPAGSEVTSAKLSTIKYIVVKSGAKELGKWFSEKRNVYEDYKRLFHEEPPAVGSIALMIDSDDTKSSAESFFGDIYLSAE